MLGGHAELTHGRLLARNVSLNVAGWVVPAVSALVAIPALVRAMGAERFGLLSLAWTLVGSFSAFDLGIGRALTQVLSERVGLDDQLESPHLTWTALALLAGLGSVAAAALVAAAPALATRWLHVSAALHGDVAAAVRLLAIAVPLLVLTSGLRGVLEAGQRFGVINGLRAPLGLLTFLGPWAIQGVSHSLTASIAVLVGARALTVALYAAAVALQYPSLRRPSAPRVDDLRRLWRVAGWMTVSTVATPILVSADRFLIGTVLPMTAVAHYATVSEFTGKLALFTVALQPVLFPALAATIAADPARAAVLFDRGVRANAIALAPPTLLLIMFAPEGLRLWLGADFARAGAPLLQWLAIAVFVNAMAAIPYATIQGSGRSDLAAKLHAAEVPIYLGILWLLLHHMGLIGVAYAWLFRMLGDGLGLLAATPVVLPQARRAVVRAAGVSVGAVLLFGACTLISPLAARGTVAALGLLMFGTGAARWLVTADERRAGRAWIAARGTAPVADGEERPLPALAAGQ